LLQSEMRCQLLANAGFIERFQTFELSLRDKPQVAKPIEGREPADAKVVRQLDDVVHLDILAAWRRTSFRIDIARLVEDGGAHPARPSLAKTRHELADAVVGRE